MRKFVVELSDLKEVGYEILISSVFVCLALHILGFEFMIHIAVDGLKMMSCLDYAGLSYGVSNLRRKK